jgi:peptidoglycan hydrolase-like protein with peptidoglycan-binding domain
VPRDSSSLIPQAVGLAAGAEGADVETLQDYLRRFGYLAQNGDGIVDPPAGDPEPARFDASTVNALRAYQRFHGLPPPACSTTPPSR